MAVLRALYGAANVPEPISVRPGTGMLAEMRPLGACFGDRFTMLPEHVHMAPNLGTLLCVQYTVTAWGKDPFARGSYSFTRSAPGGAFGAAHRK